MKHILSIDQGTTGTRAIVYDKNARPVASAYQELKQYFPRPGWVEQDCLDIWGSAVSTIRKVLQKVPASTIEAIGITNQRETTILWDRKTGRPVHNAIVWQCRRTAGICDRLKEKGYAELFRKKTGLVLDAYFSGTKIKWLLDNIKGLRRQAESGEICFGTVDAYLIWKLSGGDAHVTDYTNASRTLIFNITDKRWDSRLLKILKIPRAILPEVKTSSTLFAKVAKKNPCGLVPGTPITGDAGDQQAALFGQGCFQKGEMKNTYGTGSFLVLNTGKRPALSRKGLLTTLACDAAGETCYALEGSIFITGAAVQWLRDGLRLIRDVAETEKLAGKVSDTGGVYFVPAFVGLGAPHWDPMARGTVVGITRGTSRCHLIRATLEAIAYQVKDIVDIMRNETGQDFKSLRVDGGGCQNDFLMQFQADILGLKIIRPRVIETTAKGAAMLAGLAVGFWKKRGELKKTLAAEKIFFPRMKDAKRRALYAGWLEAVKKTRSV